MGCSLNYKSEAETDDAASYIQWPKEKPRVALQIKSSGNKADNLLYKQQPAWHT